MAIASGSGLQDTNGFNWWLSLEAKRSIEGFPQQVEGFSQRVETDLCQVSIRYRGFLVWILCLLGHFVSQEYVQLLAIYDVLHTISITP